MTGLVLVGAAVIAFFVIWHYRGAATAAFLAVLCACSLTTIDLVQIGHSSVMTATAPTVISIASFHLALLGAFLALPAQTVRRIPAPFVLFLLAIIVLAVVRGMIQPHVASGILQWTGAVLAWGVGGAIAWQARTKGAPTERLIAIAIGFVIACHGVVVALQLAGLRAVSAIDVDAVEVSRASGLAGHSGNLGKIMFVLTMILLPVTRSADRVARRWAIVGVAAAALLTGLSFSRANTVAIVALIGLWLLLGPGIGIAKRLLIPLVAVVVAFPIIDILVLRNEEDPNGGSRPILMETAWRQISETLWLGVGPNSYLDVVGRYDPLAAGGLPVHSGFVLALAELGLMCAVLLLIPLVSATFASARTVFTRGDPNRKYAVVLLGSIPGIIVIAGTGWGIIREQYLVLLFFAIGYLVAALAKTPAVTAHTSSEGSHVRQFV